MSVSVYPPRPNRHRNIATQEVIDNAGYEGVQLSYDIIDLVAKPGIIPGHVPIYEFGDRDSLTTATAGNDIWNGAAILLPRPAASGELMSIVSTSAQDGVAGTGILSVDIHYLDENGDAQEVEVTMNGLTPVDIPVILFRFVNAFYGRTWGSNGLAVGTLTIYKTGAAATVYSQIEPETNYGPDGTFMVPAGHKYFITNVSATATGNKAIKVILRATYDYDGHLLDEFIFKRGWTLENDSIAEMLRPQLVLPALAVVKATAYSVIGAGRASINFSGWIEIE